MKRMALIVGFSALLLGLALAQPGAGQMGGPPVQSPAQTQQAGNPAMGPMAMAQAESPAQLQMEIHLLRAIDMAGLSKSQLTQLQAIVGNLKSARDALPQAQQQLRDFLVSFQGTPADFEKAVAPYDQKVEAAQKALHDAMKKGVEQVKGLLTISQGEALFKVLMPRHRPMMGWDEESMRMAPMMQQMQEKMQVMMQAMQGMAGMNGMMGMMANPGMSQMQQMMEQMRAMMGRPLAPERLSWGEMLLEHLDLIDQVLTEKLASMKG